MIWNSVLNCRTQTTNLKDLKEIDQGGNMNQSFSSNYSNFSFKGIKGINLSREVAVYINKCHFSIVPSSSTTNPH